MPFKILSTGDIHVGRSSTRLPDDLPVSSTRAVNGWHSVVEHAIAQRFDLLLLSGDIADQDNKFWEAVGPLEQGVRRLAEKGIRTIAVSGNHDHDVLPRLADQLQAIDEFRLLGRDGRWERESIEVDGRVLLHVDGWSFPGAFVERDPVEDYPAAGRSDGAPVVGLLHGDLDSPTSRYARLSLARLAQQPVDGWLLGHVHKPQLIREAEPFVLYPGSPQALDFGETGAHGAWRFEVDAGRLSTPELVPLSGCRYEELTLEITDAPNEAALQALLSDAVRNAERRCRDESGDALGTLALRLRLTGRSACFDRRAAWLEELAAYTGRLPGLRSSIVELRFDVLPISDLASRARGKGLVAETARLLGLLESEPQCDEIRRLLDDARIRVEQVAAGRDYQPLRDPPAVDEESLRSVVREELSFILGQLLRQQESAP